MNTHSQKIYMGVPARNVRFEDFDISWAGEHPTGEGYLFGSEDGRLRSLKLDGSIVTTPSISPSGEAINGVAFSGRVTGVSTRAEVKFIFSGDTYESELLFDGGAHEIITISSGGFIAPLGCDGILTMVPIEGPKQVLATARFDGTIPNIYKLTHCNGNGREDLVVGAARRDGLLIMGTETLSDRITLSNPHFVTSPGLDVIDVTSLASTIWPNAVAWLGADSSIHFSRDVLEGRSSKSLRIKELRGDSYTVLQAQGHLLLLTNNFLYLFPDLITHFLENNAIPNLVSTLSMEIDLVDIQISKNNLFLIAAEHVDAIPIDSIISANQKTEKSSWTPQFIEETLTSKSAEPIWTLTSVA